MIDMPNKGKVLLLDDDKFLIDMYSVKFAQKGFTIEGCLSANEALTILKGGFAPDVILFDITMPERDGFSFLEALHAAQRAGRADLASGDEHVVGAHRENHDHFGRRAAGDRRHR